MLFFSPLLFMFPVTHVLFDLLTLLSHRAKVIRLLATGCRGCPHHGLLLGGFTSIQSKPLADFIAKGAPMDGSYYRQFILRRLHSLTGIIPLGAFLVEHFFTNSFSHQGADSYNSKVDVLRNLPYVLFLEWGLIFIPFLFHAIYGVVIMFTAAPNVGTYRFQRNWMYLWMRISAFFALAFVLFHVLTLRYGLWLNAMGFPSIHPEPNFYDLMSRIFDDPVMVVFYVIGVAATVFHFANGLNTFCMTWGLTISRPSQRRMAWASAAIGLILASMAYWSMVGFRGGLPEPVGDKEKSVSIHLAPQEPALMVDNSSAVLR